MPLATQQFGQGADLVFIHGWGANSALWRAWIEHYFADYRITLIDLPGHGQSPQLACGDEQVLDAWLEALVEVLPESAVIVGWSLGGLLAQALALRYPDRVQGLVLMASSPCFVQRDDWSSALETSLFARYLTEVMQQTQTLLKSFFSLQALGSQQPKQLIKQLLPLVHQLIEGHQASLYQGLRLLKTLDFRAELVRLTAPTLWLFADGDAIVPSALSFHIDKLQPQAQVVTISASGHLPFLAQPEQTSGLIGTFLQGILHD